MSTIWRRFLFAWAGTLPTRIINAEQSSDDPGISPLFERSHVFTVRLPFVGEVTCYLHHYLRSDPDRGVHDHPWPWAIALPIAGGYLEDRLDHLGGGALNFIRRVRRPLVPYFLTGNDFHRVIVHEGESNWSLFFHGPLDVKPWGFLRELGAGQWQYAKTRNSNGSHTRWWRWEPRGAELLRAAP